MREMCVLVNREHGRSWLRAKHAALRRKTGWLRIRKICPSGATSLSAYCCFMFHSSNLHCSIHAVV